MVQAPWTYELPATGSFAENLDDYEACMLRCPRSRLPASVVERARALHGLPVSQFVLDTPLLIG